MIRQTRFKSIARSRMTCGRNTRASRAGSVLLVVLVVIVLLALGAYTFTEMGVAENEATTMFGRGVQARSFADSGIDVAAAILADPLERSRSNPYYNRPELFAAVLMNDADVPRGRGRFSLVAPAEGDASGASLRFGLIDESGKVNLNAIAALRLDEATSRNLLMHIPSMTNETADAVLDWLDADPSPRQFGAENDYYSALSQPYRSADGPLGSLDELLLVRGVTPTLLYGEDWNRNGLLDVGEDVNGDGIFARGWNVYLTIFGAERNVRVDGSARINVNHDKLPELYDQLQAEFDEDVAKFVVAYRINGAKKASSATGSSPAGSTQSSGGRRGGGGARSSSSPQSSPSANAPAGAGNAGGASGQSTTSSTISSPTPQSGQRGGGKAPTVQRGGMDLPAQGRVKIASISELVGSQVTATVGGASKTLSSPWSAEASDLEKNLPTLFNKLTMNADEFIRGRINVNQAPSAVLMGIPGMTETIVTAIVAAQGSGGTEASASGEPGRRATVAWLVAEGLVELDAMQKLERFITARGDVYRVQSVGFFDDGGPIVRIDAVIDASIEPPRILAVRDLSELGRGFGPRQLGVP